MNHESDLSPNWITGFSDAAARESFKQAALLYKEGGKDKVEEIQQIVNTMNSKREFLSDLKQDTYSQTKS